VSAISNGINSAISTVQNSGNMPGAAAQSPSISMSAVQALAPAPYVLGTQVASANPPASGSSNTGAIVGGALLPHVMLRRWLKRLRAMALRTPVRPTFLGKN
jgi:hypothetical protein